MIKIITFAILTLLSCSLYSQGVVSCPLTLTFQQDTITQVWGMTASGTTEWKEIAYINPDPKSKNEYEHFNWIALECKPVPNSSVFATFIATQNRYNPYYGVIEMKGHYCAYSFLTVKKK